MSSRYARQSIISHLESNTEIPLCDLDGIIDDDNLPIEEKNWIGIQFVGNSKELIGNPEYYREYGAILFHFCTRKGKGISPDEIRNEIHAMYEELEPLLVQKRINSTIITEDMSTPNFSDGAAIQWKKGYVGATSSITYYIDSKG